MAMYSQSASSLFGLNCIWLAVDFSFIYVLPLAVVRWPEAPHPLPPLPLCLPSLSLIAWRAAFCLYFSVCQLLATKLNTCLCFLWPTHWLKLASGRWRGRCQCGRGRVLTYVCMYNLAINRVPFQPDS